MTRRDDSEDVAGEAKMILDCLARMPDWHSTAVARDVLLATAATIRIDPAIYSIVSERIGPGVYELRLKGCGL